MDTGILGLAWPFQDTPEQVVKQVIEIKTLPEWSQFSPLTRKFSANTTFLKPVSQSGMVIDQRTQQNAGQYFLPDEVMKYPDLLTIRSIRPDFSWYDQDNNVLYNYNAGNAYELGPQMIDAAAFSGFVGQMGIQQPFEFIEPNRIFIKGLYGPITIVAAYEHQTLQTVNANSRSYIMELAVLDVKSYLYQLLKHYNGIKSAYTDIMLKIDEWSSADNDRTTLINTWRERYGDGQSDFFQYL